MDLNPPQSTFWGRTGGGRIGGRTGGGRIGGRTGGSNWGVGLGVGLGGLDWGRIRWLVKFPKFHFDLLTCHPTWTSSIQCVLV